MERLDDIENFFKKDIERIDKEYLEKIKNPTGIDRKNLEEIYKKKLMDSKKNYEKKYKGFLENQSSFIKSELNKKKNYKQKREKYKTLEIKKLNLQPTFSENLKKRLDIFKFRYKIKKNKIINSITPNWYTSLKFKIRLKRKKIRQDLRIAFSRFFKDLGIFFSKLFLSIKNIVLKIFTFIKSIIIRIFSIFKKSSSKKDKKTSPEENKEEKT